MPESLRSRLASGGLVVAPGIFDMISLRLAIAAGARTVYMSGYGTVASHLGLPDAGLASYRDMVDRVETFGACCRENGVALIADGDTGYGGVVNVAHTVRGYEAAGAQAIQLEDQTFPKKCGHTKGRSVIPTDEMVTKIRVAAETRKIRAAALAAVALGREPHTAHRTPPRVSSAQSRMEIASASLSSAGAKPRARTAAIIAAFGAFPLPVAWRLMVPTGTPW